MKWMLDLECERIIAAAGRRHAGAPMPTPREEQRADT